MNQTKTYVGLVRDVAPFVSGIEEVERFIGRDFEFHDAELDDIHLCREENSVTIGMLSLSTVSSYDHSGRIDDGP